MFPRHFPGIASYYVWESSQAGFTVWSCLKRQGNLSRFVALSKLLGRKVGARILCKNRCLTTMRMTVPTQEIAIARVRILVVVVVEVPGDARIATRHASASASARPAAETVVGVSMTEMKGKGTETETETETETGGRDGTTIMTIGVARDHHGAENLGGIMTTAGVIDASTKETQDRHAVTRGVTMTEGIERRVAAEAAPTASAVDLRSPVALCLSAPQHFLIIHLCTHFDFLFLCSCARLGRPIIVECQSLFRPIIVTRSLSGGDVDDKICQFWRVLVSSTFYVSVIYVLV